MNIIALLVSAAALISPLAVSVPASYGSTSLSSMQQTVHSRGSTHYPNHILNGDFQYMGEQIINSNPFPDGERDGYVNVAYESGEIGVHSSWAPAPDGFTADEFAWKSTQTDTSIDERAPIVELQSQGEQRNKGQVYGEITASQEGTAIYQDIATEPGAVYTWSLDHGQRNADSEEAMSVVIGAPGKEEPQTATRTHANGLGDQEGESSTVISTHGTMQAGQAETYEGSYVVPAGQTVTRFSFLSVTSSSNVSGNCVDNIKFNISYPLTYDLQGGVGLEPGKTSAGSKRTRVYQSGLKQTTLPSELINGSFDYPQLSWPSTVTGNWTSIDQDNGRFMSGLEPCSTVWQPIPDWDRGKFGWQSTQEHPGQQGYCPGVAHAVEIQRDRSGNVYAEINDSEVGTAIYQDVATTPGAIYSWKIRHASLTQEHDDSLTVNIGEPGHETAQEVTRTVANGHGDQEGPVGTTITSHVTNTDGRDHEGQWETYEGSYQVPTGQHVTRFTFRFLSGPSSSSTIGNLVDDIEFKIAYPLNYHPNSGIGQVPGRTRGGFSARAVKASTARANDDGSLVLDGCRVYYPAGAHINLATLAKDSDCWDSSMLSKSGFDLLGWSETQHDSMSGENAANRAGVTDQIVMPASAKTVYAVWAVRPTLAYNTNLPDGAQTVIGPASVTVPYGAPAKDTSTWQVGDTTLSHGLRFSGWYDDQECTVLHDFTVPLVSDSTVYAKWEEYQSNLVFNPNGGSGTMNPLSGVPGDSVPVSSNGFIRTGWRFTGWNTQADGSGKGYKPGDQWVLLPPDTKGVLYAQWVPVTSVLPQAGGGGLSIMDWLPIVGLSLGLCLLTIGVATWRKQWQGR